MGLGAGRTLTTTDNINGFLLQINENKSHSIEKCKALGQGPSVGGGCVYDYTLIKQIADWKS